MPSTSENKTIYTHQPNFTPEDFSLRPHRAKEQRYVPRAYAPTAGTIAIHRNFAEFTLEYSVKEAPSRQSVQIGDGVIAMFGKFTRKLVLITFSYSDVDALDSKIGVAIRGLKRQKQVVPQDSIKRNYDMAASALNYLADAISKDMPAIKEHLAQMDKE